MSLDEQVTGFADTICSASAAIKSDLQRIRSGQLGPAEVQRLRNAMVAALGQVKAETLRAFGAGLGERLAEELKRRGYGA